MGDSPWDGAGQRYQQGITLTGQVTAIASCGAYVEAEPDIEGLVPVGPDGIAESAFPVGDEIGVFVLVVDERKHVLRLGVFQ